MPPLQRLTPGEEFSPSADTWNAFRETARRVLEARAVPPSPPAPTAAAGTPDRVWVRNDSQQDLDRFAVVGLDELLVTATDNFEGFAAGPALSAVVPQIEQHYQRFAVLQEPLPAGKVGAAIAHGATVCKIDVQHTDDQFCTPVDAQTGSLVSGAGSCRILSKLTATGEQWALVQLGAQSPQRWMPWKNANGREMPAYGLILLQQPDDPDSNILKSQTSNSPYRVPFAVNYPAAVQSGGYGLCTQDFPAWIAYVSTATPSLGALFGYKSGEDEVYRFGSGGTDIGVEDSAGGFELLGPRRTSPTRGLMIYDASVLTAQPLIRFTLTADLSTTTQKVSADQEASYGNAGPNVGFSEVWNILDDSAGSGNYIFSGTTGDTGLAFYSPAETKYYILWLECATSCG